MVDIEKLAQTFFEAAYSRTKELDPTMPDTSWGEDKPDAEIGREAFRAGTRALVAVLGVSD